MICFAFFRWHQKSLGVQGGQPGSNMALNRSLKLGPRDREHALTRTHTNTSQGVPLFFFFFSSFPVSPAKSLQPLMYCERLLLKHQRYSAILTWPL